LRALTPWFLAEDGALLRCSPEYYKVKIHSKNNQSNVAYNISNARHIFRTLNFRNEVNGRPGRQLTTSYKFKSRFDPFY